MALNVLVLLGYGGCFALAAILLANGSIDIGGFGVVVYALSRFMAMTSVLSREFGTTDLSGGQWQRVAIARGLYRAYDTMLLDEPTASIDPLQEQALYEGSLV